MYDSFSSNYDRFVNWPGRLAYEMPFIEQVLKQACSDHPCRILDTACGTGMHALALAQKGYSVVGTDNSAGMIEQARLNKKSQGPLPGGGSVQFITAGFGELAERLDEPFDVLLCLGNSLPHLLTPQELRITLKDFATCLKPGCLLLVQNRNFDAVMVSRERWMEPQSYREDGREWIFLRFYDFDADGLISFHIVNLEREGEGPWRQSITTTCLMPLLKDDLVGALDDAGFRSIKLYGDMQGNPFDLQKSGNLVVTARAR